MATQLRAVRTGATLLRSVRLHKVSLCQTRLRIQTIPTCDTRLLGSLNDQRLASTYVRQEKSNTDAYSRDPENGFSSNRKPYEQRSRADSRNDRKSYGQGVGKSKFGGDSKSSSSTWRQGPENGTKKFGGKERSFGKPRYGNRETSHSEERGQRKNDRPLASVGRFQSGEGSKPRSYGSRQKVDSGKYRCVRTSPFFLTLNPPARSTR